MSQPYQHDFCDEAGAAELKRRIEDYWIGLGFPPPDVKLNKVGFVAPMRTHRFDLRSDLRNGLPSKAYQEKLARAA